jgi:hypothetical protein
MVAECLVGIEEEGMVDGVIKGENRVRGVELTLRVEERGLGSGMRGKGPFVCPHQGKWSGLRIGFVGRRCVVAELLVGFGTWEDKVLGRSVGLVIYGVFWDINYTQAPISRYLIYLQLKRSWSSLRYHKARPVYSWHIGKSSSLK